MGKRFKGSRATVLIGLNLTDADEQALKVAEALCKRTKMSLRLVHVTEPWIGPSWALPLAGEASFGNVIQTVEDQAQKRAILQLENIATRFSKITSVATNVLTGRIAHCLISDAVANKASLILVGASGGSHRFVPRGLSTALSLMAESPLPVMVINKNCNLDLNKPSLKILAADDLSDNSLSVVHVAYDLAASLGKTDLEHIHVNGLDIEVLKATLANISATTHTPITPQVSAEMIYESIRKQLFEKMKMRSPLHMVSLEAAAGKYTYNVINGPVTDVIKEEVEKNDIDILVCGRHQTFHRKPFLIGRVPFSALMSLNRALVIAPPEA